MKKLLTNKLYMILFFADLFSNFGDVLYYLALMNYVLLLPEAKLAIAMISLSEILPILSGFVTGHLADRTTNKIDTIIGTLIFRTLLYLIVGFVMGFQPALWIVILAITVNFFSDLAGQYENGLYYPISLRLVDDADREMSSAFKQATFSGLYIVFQAAGAVLITMMSYSNLALLNAFTFAVPGLIMILLRQRLLKLLNEKKIVRQEQAEVEVTSQKSPKSPLGQMWSSLRIALKELMAMPEVKPLLIAIPVLNGVFSGLTVMVLLVIKADPDFVIFNAPTTLAVISISLGITGILGNILSIRFFKDKKMLDFAVAIVILLFFGMLSLFFHLSYMMILSIAMSNIVTGFINPKFMAMLMNRVPESRIATVSGSIFSYFQLGTIVLNLILSGLIVLLPVQGVLGFYVCASFALMIYVIMIRRKENPA